jgi:Uma2 family endonuclease
MARHGQGASPPLLTIEEFERLSEPDDHKVELVRGMVVREPLPSPYHGRSQALLAYRLSAFVEEQALGVVFTEIGVVTSREPGTVRGPDVAYFSFQRLPDPLPKSFFETAPSLIVEVVSPSNSVPDILRKVAEYLEVGTEMVWVIDPIKRSAIVYYDEREIRLLSEDDLLVGGEVLPGLSLRLRDVLP